jgi:hypothetical protein
MVHFSLWGSFELEYIHVVHKIRYRVQSFSVCRKNFDLAVDLHTETQFLDKIHTKVLRVFLLAIHSHLYYFTPVSISSNSRNLLCISSNPPNLLHISTLQLLYTAKEKGGKHDRKPYPIPYGLRNPYRNLTSESYQDYA